MYILLMLSGKPGWWLILLFVPVVSIVFYLLAMLALAGKFGRGAGFGIGLWLCRCSSSLSLPLVVRSMRGKEHAYVVGEIAVAFVQVYRINYIQF